jgi:site-specific DNA-methyltransferase (adenine-specific)
MILKEQLNKVHHLNFLDNDLPDKCAKLIIADPPYYKTKGDFDFIWKTFEDYLIDVEKWCLECKRILADNGTLFWYGGSKNIAYAQIIFDKHFNLLSNITCHIYDRQTNKILIEDARSFISTTERILMYANGNNYHDEVRISTKYVQDYLHTITNRDELAQLLLKNGNCRNILSAKQNANNILNQSSAKPQLITEYQYNLIPNKNKKKYEDLRKEHNDLKRPFNPNEKYKMDVLRVSQEGHITGNYDHETVKPEKLTRILIKTCSRENDLLIIPFSGSGTECAMSAKENRNFVGYEITKKHVEMSNKRVKKILSQPYLF